MASLPLRWLWRSASVAGILCAGLLHLLRRRPSAALSLAVKLAFLAACLGMFALAQPLWAQAGVPYEAFAGNKLLLVGMALFLPRPLWLGLLLEAVFAAEAVGLYARLHMATIAERLCSPEPWATLLYAAVGVGLLVMREQRRVASVALLRLEAERSALQRRTLLYLALRDQINTPLQTLTMGAALMRIRLLLDLDEQRIVDEAVARLTAIAGALPSGEELTPSDAIAESFDGAGALSIPRP
jgi:hypothetical protein